MTGVKTTFCGLVDRNYGAECMLANARLHQPKDQDGEQVTDLKFRIYNLTPADLAKSCLGGLAFPKRRSPDQLHMDEAGKEPMPIMALDGEYKPSSECTSDGFNVNIYPANQKTTFFELVPSQGIAVKKMVRSAKSTEADPCVDIEMMVKGLPTAEVGRVDPQPWTLMEFELGFVPKIGSSGDDGEKETEDEE